MTDYLEMNSDDGDQDNDKALFFNLLKEEFSDEVGRVSANNDSRSDIVVYLAGPIEVYLEVANPYSLVWREEITALFESDPDIVWDVRNPCSGKTNFEKTRFEKRDDNTFLFNSYNVVNSDIIDVKDSDVVIFNLLNLPTKASCTGTFIEYGIAHSNNKFLIVICEEDSPLRKHPFLYELTHCFASSVIEAFYLTKVAYENGEFD